MDMSTARVIVRCPQVVLFMSLSGKTNSNGANDQADKKIYYGVCNSLRERLRTVREGSRDRQKTDHALLAITTK